LGGFNIGFMGKNDVSGLTGYKMVDFWSIFDQKMD